MDISHWNMGQIMQLPDFVFGAQECVSKYIGTSSDATTYFKIEQQLPPWFVVWSILVEAESQAQTKGVNLALRLGDAVPTEAILRTKEKLIMNKSSAAQLYDWHLPAVGLKHITGLRQLVDGKGRHIIGALKMVNENVAVESIISVFITPIPKEAPDWLVKI